MSWAAATAARQAARDEKARRLQDAMQAARSLKEADYLAGIPPRTARRLRARLRRA